MANRTVEQWLAYGDKLGVELGWVFTPGPWEHEPMNSFGICKRCGARPVIWCEGKPFYDNDSCEPPHKIKIDWDTAMEWFRNGDPHKSYAALIKVAIAADGTVSLPIWLARWAGPEHYLAAAAMAIEGGKE